MGTALTTRMQSAKESVPCESTRGSEGLHGAATTAVPQSVANPQPESEETTPLLLAGDGQRAGAAARMPAPEAPSDNRASVVAGQLKDDTQPPSWRQVMRLIYPYIAPRDAKQLSHLVAAIAAELAQKVLRLLPPVAIKHAINIISANSVKPTAMASAPIIFIVGYFAADFISGVIRIVQRRSKQQLSLDATQKFAVNAFEHLHKLGLAYHLERKTGEVTSFIRRGASSIDTLIDMVLFTLIPTLFETLLVVGIFWKMGVPTVAFTVFITMAAYVSFGLGTTKLIADLRRTQNELHDEVTSKEVDTLLSYQTVTTFAMNGDEIRDYDLLRQESKQQKITMAWTTNLLRFAQGTLWRVGVSVGLCIACYATVHGDPRLSSGDVVAIRLYIFKLITPFINLDHMYKAVAQAFTSLEKAVVAFDRQPQIVDSRHAREWLPASRADHASQGEIEFRNVSFRYVSSKADSSGGVSGISFHVAAGKKVALVGASGSGKSTLVRLTLRLYEVDGGAIFVNGQDITALTQESLRRNIGIVAQDTVLFNNTLRYNISYGKPGATDAEIWSAVHAAALEDMIDQLPNKLETKVGERGLKLSGGERQRVGIARCLIKNPAILLFDEATSALDSATEREIQDNLADVCRNKTTIVIAHRLSTIIRADEILVLDQGMIKERGTHKELVALGGKYASMWDACQEA